MPTVTFQSDVSPGVLNPDQADENFRYLKGDRVAKTISSGAITVEGTGLYTIDTEAAAGTDDLDTINGGTEGAKIQLWSVSAAREITIRHAVGNIRLMGGQPFTHDSIYDVTELVKIGSIWSGSGKSIPAT